MLVRPQPLLVLPGLRVIQAQLVILGILEMLVRHRLLLVQLDLQDIQVPIL